MRVEKGQVGVVVLIGSGEFSELIAKAHRAVMARVSGPVRPIFIDTPAGFQLNVDQIAEKAMEYFKKRFNLDLALASFKSARTATLEEMSADVALVRQSQYIFAGPGSPTYTIRNWRGTPVYAAMLDRLAEGGNLSFASAAVIALSHYSVPVYEIYKVGDDPHWVEGLDLFGRYGLDLAIVPHWNNAEGGTHDTRFCYLGEPRLHIMEEMLPPSTTILGIDEYTACIVDIGAERCQVMGAGTVTIRRHGEDRVFPHGSTFEFGDLRV